MSQTWSLHCHEAKLKLWCGQGGPDAPTVYDGHTEHRPSIAEFLQRTAGKPVVLLIDDAEEDAACGCEEMT